MYPTARYDQPAPNPLYGAPPSPFSLLKRFALFLRRNALLISTVGAAVGGAAFLAGNFTLRQYHATAVLMVDPRAARVTQNSGVLANIGSDFNAIESIVQIAKSEAFLGSVVDQLELTHDPVFAGKGATEDQLRQSTIDNLASRLSIARRGTTYVIDVTVKAPSAEKAAKVANGAARKILEDQTNLRSGLSARTAATIEGRLSELRERVGKAEEAAADLKAKMKVTDAGQGSTLLERRVYELNQQLVLAGARTAEARARYELLRKAGPSAGNNLPQAAQSPIFSSLRAEYARLSRQSADQATVLGPKHPEVVSLNAQISDIRRQLTAEIGRMTSTARAEYQESEGREADLARQLKEAQTESGELGPQMVKLAELEREAKAERAVYEELLSRQRELRQVKDLEPSDIRIVSPAATPPKPLPGRIVVLAVSAIIGLLAGTAAAAIREWRGRTLKTALQAERLGGVEVFGFLPTMPRQGPDRDAAQVVPDLTPWLTELCAEVTPEVLGAESVVIFVTSAHRGEGRSTIAVNLAAYLSEGGDRVLLVEADRAAHVKKPPYGLLDVLESGEDLKGALVEQAADGYTLLPYGGRMLNRHSSIGGLMSGMTLRAALKLARKWFDVIVIDGPPALEAPHARFLAAQADYTVFLIEWDKTSADDADAALDRLDAGATAVLYNKADAARLSLYDPEQSRQMALCGEGAARAA
ncbi:GumC family protein [Methylocystis sp. JAN1]|uniref:GumC family protein n=1 Tax=Methylocystis sp. JAN1 TaxID=3397211 RepID=UPI003FA324DD